MIEFVPRQANRAREVVKCTMEKKGYVGTVITSTSAARRDHTPQTLYNVVFKKGSTEVRVLVLQGNAKESHLNPDYSGNGGGAKYCCLSRNV